MLTNAKITAWLKRSGNDGDGQPTYTDGVLPPGGLACLAEPKTTRLKRGERELVSTMRASIGAAMRYLPAPGIAAGDRVTLSAVSYEVLEVAVATHRTLGHVTLLLG